MEDAKKVEETRVIAAIIENRAREVGLAVMDLNSMVLGLHQYVETSFTYSLSL